MVEVEYLKEIKSFSPQEISAMVLMKVQRLPLAERNGNGADFFIDERSR